MSVYYISNFLRCPDCPREFHEARIRVRHELAMVDGELIWVSEWEYFWKSIWKNPLTGLYESNVSFWDKIDYKNAV